MSLWGTMRRSGRTATVPENFLVTQATALEVSASPLDRKKITVSQGTVYYKTARDVSAGNNDGSIASGGSLTVSNTTWLLSSGNSLVSVADVDEIRDTWLNVRDYGAYGDGVRDDTAAIQSALNAVPASGGAVFFPAGDYLVTAPLTVKSYTTILGSGGPSYDSALNPAGACKIRCGAGMTGNALIDLSASTKRGVHIRNLSLVGNNQGSGVAGVRFPTIAVNSGEQGTVIENVHVAGMSGPGITGRAWVVRLDGCHISRCQGYGIEVSGSDKWTDSKVSGCYLYFNRDGAAYFGGGVSSGVEFTSCRFERSGGNPASVASPVNSSAPGVKLEKGDLLQFVNCSTDANMGNGVEIVQPAANQSASLKRLWFVGCRFNRDGTGDQVSQGNYAGVKVLGYSSSTGADGVLMAQFTNCFVGTGKADDSGAGTIVGPKYGVWVQNTEEFGWVGGKVDGQTQAWYASATFSNYRPTIYDVKNGLFQVPLDAPPSAIDTNGFLWFDTADNKLKVRVGGATKATAALA